MRYLFAICFLVTGTCLSQSRDTLVIATYQYADNPRIKNLEPFAKEFSHASGFATRVLSYPTVNALLEGLKRSEADVVFINTFGYLLYKSNHNDYQVMANLTMPAEVENTYQSVIVASRRSNLQNFDDVRKASKSLDVLFVNPGSTSGNLIPRLKLATENLAFDSCFKTVTYTTNHALTLQLIAENKADLGAFGSEEYDNAARNKLPLANGARLLWRSEAIPLGPVMYHRKLSHEIVEKLSEVIFGLHQANPLALQSIKNAWTEAKHATHFQRINENFYEGKIDLNSSNALRIIEQFAR